ncbi:MAG: carbamoyltransferase HypF [Pseudomonadota bacterium]
MSSTTKAVAVCLDEVDAPISRQRIIIEGRVQGVGFRPFVHRLAHALDLTGWVANGPEGVVAEVQGCASAIATFRRDLRAKAPSLARIDHIHHEASSLREDRGFVVRTSLLAGDVRPIDLVDRVTCADCLDDIRDPANRRYRYPFTTCTACGPRFSIVDALPYDRARTAMSGFSMCAACRAEYENPDDRRFHAETQACPDCGPTLAYQEGAGRTLATCDEALEAAAADLRAGQIIALKGLGGFQLLVDARNEDAVARLRARKQRAEKPFALMVQDIDQASKLAMLAPRERDMLAGPAGPIVLVTERDDAPVYPAVAPALPWLGLMLPTTPLHHLLLDAVGVPVVVTSGNLNGEPMAIEIDDARTRLGSIADRFLTHDRPIRRPLDDSVQRLIARRPITLRLGRGLAPLTVSREGAQPTMLALGGQEKTAVAIASQHGIVLGPHIGDLDTLAARAAHEAAVVDIERTQGVSPELVVCDRHPDYASTGLAERIGKPVRRIQHHAAHVFSLMTDNDLASPLLGFAFDGTGYGEDGTIWGGEAILVTEDGWRRVASFRPFALPGGEMAIREPRRTAIALLLDALGEDVVREQQALMPIRSLRASDLAVLKRMIETKLNTPMTSSVGRLFDAAAAIIGIRQITSYSGQAAIELEGRTGRTATSLTGAYPFDVDDNGNHLVVDWRPAIRALVDDVGKERDVGEMATAFQNGIADVMVDIARKIGRARIGLTGGCFQNRYLTECAKDRLEAAGFTVHLHRNVPPNDGGLAVGQIACAAFEHKRETPSCV